MFPNATALSGPFLRIVEFNRALCHHLRILDNLLPFLFVSYANALMLLVIAATAVMTLTALTT